MKYCSKCGIQNDDEVLFCLNCGNKFEITDQNQEQNQFQQIQPMQPIESVEPIQTIQPIQQQAEQSEQQPQQPQFYQPQQPQQPPPQQQQYYQPPQQQQQYQPYQPQMGYYVQPRMPVPGKGMAIASLVLGICSIVYLFILGIVGIVLAVMGRKKMRSVGAPTGIATAGLVLSIIGTIIGSILFFTCIAALGAVACYSPVVW